MTIGISLYASGYKFNLSWPIKFNRLLQKTGMLAVATKPTRATVFLNDKIQNDSSLKPWKKDYVVTPAKIKNLLPGEYELRVEEDGYWPYKQKIRINSGETTFVEDVILFKENIPLQILATPLDSLSISPDKKYLYVNQARKVITLKTELTRDLIFSGSSTATWLKNNKIFVDGIIFDPSRDNNDIDYFKTIGTGATNLYFDDASGKIFYQNKDSINQLETNNRTSSLLTSGSTYLGYLPGSDKLFTLENINNVTFLNSYSLRDFKRGNNWTLPNSGHYTFIKDINSRLAIYDDINKTFYLFNSSDISSGPLTIRNIKTWTVQNDQSLIYTDGFDIYELNFQNGRSDLITRRGEEINELIWNNSDNYLIFSTATSLNVLDFKNQNTTLLFNAEQISSPIFDEKNNDLYFWAKIGDQEGIYKMLLQ